MIAQFGISEQGKECLLLRLSFRPGLCEPLAPSDRMEAMLSIGINRLKTSNKQLARAIPLSASKLEESTHWWHWAASTCIGQLRSTGLSMAAPGCETNCITLSCFMLQLFRLLPSSRHQIHLFRPAKTPAMWA
jgi:hypothetical protein